MAIVAQGNSGRIYLPPTLQHSSTAEKAKPEWKPDVEFFQQALGFRVGNYGMQKWSDLFTARQTVSLTTFSDLVADVIDKCLADSLAAGMLSDGEGLDAGGVSATAYAEAIGVYLGLALGRAADYWTGNATWESGGGFIAHAFTKQAIPMVWDFAEGNPFSHASGNWDKTALDWVIRVIREFRPIVHGHAQQRDAAQQRISESKIVSTDPPYYDNIGYADLSDYFYVWMRRTLRSVFPDLFAALVVPKNEELVATPYRHGGKEEAECFFLKGMACAMKNLCEQAHPAFPITIYYAFKQSETKASTGTSSTGWETFLDAVVRSGFALTGTWPMHTERGVRSRGIGSNALASSIILVCRKRDPDVPAVSRKQFLRLLENELPEALEAMIGGREGATAVAPVDLAQAAIGPGMAVFSRYAAVLEADGTPMSVRVALTLINKSIDGYFSQAEGEMDADTRFCVDWFQQHGFSTGVFGTADVLARAKGTSVDGVREAGAVASGGGKVRLLAVGDYTADWDPTTDKRIPVWQACHQMARALMESESAAGALLARMPEKTESIRQLAYRLYTVCERKGWAEEARIYNGLITSWHAIVDASHQTGHKGEQIGMDV